jgi:hypothetical protein
MEENNMRRQPAGLVFMFLLQGGRLSQSRNVHETDSKLCYRLHVSFLLGLLFDPGDGDETLI